MKCIKVYPDMRNNPRLRHLNNAQRWVWFRLLCFAGEQPERGTIVAASERILAIEVADGDVALMNKTLSALSGSGCIEVRLDGDGSSDAFRVRFTAFQECFSVSRRANLSTPRVHKHREAKRLRQVKHETHVKQNETAVSPPPSPLPCLPLASPSYSSSLPPPGVDIFARTHAREGENPEPQGNPEPTPPHRPAPAPSPPGGPDYDTPEGMLALLRDGDAVDVWPGDHSPTAAQVEATFRAAWKVGGVVMAREYFARQRFHSPRAWHDAFLRVQARPGGVRSIAYVEAIAANNPDGIRPAAPSGPRPPRADVGGPEAPTNKVKATPEQIRSIDEAVRLRREANLARERERGPWPEGVGIPWIGGAVRELLKTPPGTGGNR